MNIDPPMLSGKYLCLNNSQEDLFIILHLLLMTTVSRKYNDYNNYLILDQKLEDKPLLSIIGFGKYYTDVDPQKAILLSKIRTLYKDSRYNQIHKHIRPNHLFWQNKLLKDAKNRYSKLEEKNENLKNFFQKLEANDAQDITMTSAKETLEFWYTIILFLINDSEIKNKYRCEINKEISISMLIMDIKNFTKIFKKHGFENFSIEIDVLCNEKNKAIENLIKNLIVTPNSEEEKSRINDLINNFSKISYIISSEEFIRLFENQKSHLIEKHYLVTINNALNSRTLFLKYLSDSLSHQQIDIMIDKMLPPIIKEALSQFLYIYDFLASEKLRNRNIILRNTSEDIKNLLPTIMKKLFCCKKLCQKLEGNSFDVIKNNYLKSKFVHLSEEEIMRYYDERIEKTEINQNNHTAAILQYSSDIQKSKSLGRDLSSSCQVNIKIRHTNYGLDIQKWSLLNLLSEIFKKLDIDIDKFGETSTAILDDLVSKDFSEEDLLQSLYTLIANSSHGIDDDGIKIIKSYSYKKHHHKLVDALSSKIIIISSIIFIDETKLPSTYYSKQIRKTLLKNKISLDIKENHYLIKIFFNNISLSPNQKSNLSFLGWIFLAVLIPHFKHRERIIYTISAVSIIIIASKLTYQYFISIQNRNLSTNLANITENHIRITQIENANNSPIKLH